ncbi:MAG: hypothetical protein B6245_08495 [Desulfobacteraceae bacterium 4572_88]|nr:MAG: hypothetical protein B6245_08495 [Desulfobacteraceae bacterium 4572_88]
MLRCHQTKTKISLGERLRAVVKNISASFNKGNFQHFWKICHFKEVNKMVKCLAFFICQLTLLKEQRDADKHR